MKQPYRLGRLLLQKRLISQSQLDSALSHQRAMNMPLGEALVDLGFISERQIKRALNKQSRIRLYAAAVAFCMAPFNWCHASDDDIEHLPEYSFTQVADQHFASGNGSFDSFAIDQTHGLDLVEITTSAAWYLYQGGLADNQLNDVNYVPVKMKLATNDNDGYKLQMSISF